MAANTVTLTFAGDSRQLERTFSRVGQSSKEMANTVSASSNKFGTELASAFKVAGAAALTAGTAIATGAAAAIAALLPLSRHIQDLDAKSKAVFEDQLPDVQAWAEANRKAFGTSSREVVGMAANLADLLKPMGFTAAQAADMAKKLLNLSGALAKWSGGTKTAKEVSDILTDALLGERDSLKSLGISISQADVDARLAAKGQQDLTGAALQQAEALATQELIFEKSTDAQKAWADGGMAAAEQQGALSSAVDTLKEKLAKALTPAFQEATSIVAGWADKALSAFGDVGGTVNGFNSNELKNLKDAFQSVADTVGSSLRDAFANLKQWIANNKDEIKKFTDQVAAFTKDVGPILAFLIATIAIQLMETARAVMFLVDALSRLTKWYKDNAWWLSPFASVINKIKGGGSSAPSLPSSPAAASPGGGGGMHPQFFHSGGIVQGAPGSDQMAILQAGETVLPLGQSSGSVTIEINSGGSDVDDLLVKILSRAIKARGGNVQLALGR